MDMNNRILRIKAERLSRGWNQTELAYFAQMSSADVSKIESGRMVPYPGHAQRLARVLGLEPLALFPGSAWNFTLSLPSLFLSVLRLHFSLSLNRLRRF